MLQALEIEYTEKYFRRFNTENDVQRTHDRLVEEFNAKKSSIDKKIIFPICLLEDTDDIKQLTNYYELFQEGKEMHHCIGSYKNRLLNEEIFIYKVFKPERATLMLNQRNNQFTIQQFKLACNKNPTDESYLKIRKWLDG